MIWNGPKGYKKSIEQGSTVRHPLFRKGLCLIDITEIYLLPCGQEIEVTQMAKSGFTYKHTDDESQINTVRYTSEMAINMKYQHKVYSC